MSRQIQPKVTGAKGVIMTYAELQFLLAEAREKGIIDVGSAETYYTKGMVHPLPIMVSLPRLLTLLKPKLLIQVLQPKNWKKLAIKDG